MVMAQPKFLECWRLRKEFPTSRGWFVAVRDFTLNVALGEFVSIIGHSGCGKSTVLSMIAGLHPISGGGMVLDNQEVDGAGPDRAVVFQSPNLLPWMSALDNVKLGLEQIRPQWNDQRRTEVASHWLARVGLSCSLRKFPSELSQGMQQRVGIARAFALEPKVLLLDEPFGMLDSLTRIELQDILLEVWTTHQITTLMVTHDVDEAVLLSDRVVMMTNGPAATIGDVLSISFARPRDRAALIDQTEFQSYRSQVINFLHHRDERAA
jgi:nitrate ABC transporter ATP-binding subunit